MMQAIVQDKYGSPDDVLQLREIDKPTVGDDEVLVGVTLTTEDQANVSLYEHLGYEVVGQATVAPELRTWGFFRPD